MREIYAVPSLLVFALATGSLAQNVLSFLSSLTSTEAVAWMSGRASGYELNGTPASPMTRS